MDVTALLHLVNHSHTLGLKRMVPCGIPDTIIFPSGTSPSIRTFCVLPLRKSASHSVMSSVNPYTLNLDFSLRMLSRHKSILFIREYAMFYHVFH